MGKTTTPTYRIEYFTAEDGNLKQTLCWPKGKKATAANLEDVRKTYNESFKVGGCNAHCGPLTITSMTLVHQESGRVVARSA
jgi:hypothetical protein